ncbi:MAG: gamma-glutamyltransferase [Planctomycetaceae bacterium]|nr:gamma-glutamyltransferase [Planctomycetaceae bacterium]
MADAVRSMPGCYLIVAMWVALTLSALQPVAAQSPTASLTFEHGVVAADHPAASDAGAEILKQGGNAVDAAVATGFALSVVRPESSGLGGGGFLLFWSAANKKAYAIDYRERAPLAATASMYTQDGRAANASQRGGLAAAVPGHALGLCAALERFGSLPLATVLAPAIRLAEQGVEVDAFHRDTQRGLLRHFDRHREDRETYKGLWEKYLNHGIPWQVGDRFYSPQLPALQKLAEVGPSAFTSGEVGQSLLKTVRDSGGIWTADDLKQELVVFREPLHTDFQGRDIWTMPPPSSGGIALIQTLELLERYEAVGRRPPLGKLGPDHPAARHRLLEALQHAFANRATYLGDADFIDVPVDQLLSQEHLDRMAASFEETKTLPSEAYGRHLGVDDAGTTHFSIIDRHGNAVACTETINTTFGSWVVDPEFGIVLNNEMDDFTAQPGKPNAFGLLQSEANAVAPRKKPLSSMTPTIVVQDGEAKFVLGASGGPRIITTTIQVLLGLTVFNLPPEEAVSRPRMHHQWLPREVLVEPETPADLRTSLVELGHVLRPEAKLAACQVVARTAAGFVGMSDPRKHGRPAGY